MTLYQWITLLLLIIEIGLATFVYFHNPHSRINRIFFYLLLMNSYLLFIDFQLNGSESVEKAVYWSRAASFWPFILFFVFYFSLAYTQNDKKNSRKDQLLSVLFVTPAVILSYCGLFSEYFSYQVYQASWGWGYYFSSNQIISYFIFIWVFFVYILSLSLLVHYYFMTENLSAKKQTFTIIIALFFPFTISLVTDFFLPFLKIKFPSLYNPSTFLANLVLVIGIYKFNLFSICKDMFAYKVIQTLPDALFMINLNKSICSVNQTALNLLSYTETELLHQPFDFLLADKKSLDLDRILVDLTIRMKNIRDIEVKLKSKSGDVIPVPLSISVFKSNNYHGYLFILLGHDFSERKDLEQLRIQKEAAETANEMKSRFLANVSHDIRTPMNSIIGFTNLLLEEERNIAKKEKLSIINQAGEFLLNLINNILNFSKIEAGKLELHNYNFSLKQMLKYLNNIFLIKANQSNNVFNVHISDQIPDMVYGDEIKLNQILTNLLSNAFKFTQNGVVTLECDYLEGLTIFKIIDTGIGISDEEQAKIFLPYKQGVSSKQFYHGGTGLGLSITKQMVEIMGGVISLESMIDMGSIFTIQLPLPRVTEETCEEKDILDIIHQADKTIAIFTQQENKIIVLKNKLNANGYFIKIYSHFNKNLLDIEFQKTVDFLLLDLEFNQGEYLEILEEIRKNHYTFPIPIIVLEIPSSSESIFDYKMVDLDPLISHNIILKDLNYIKIDLLHYLAEYFLEKDDNSENMVQSWIDQAGDDSDLKDIIIEGIGDLSQRIVELGNCIKHNDQKCIKEQSHSFKGFSGMYELKDIYEILIKIDAEISKKGYDIKKINQYFLKLCVIYYNIPKKYKIMDKKLKDFNILVAEDDLFNQKLIGALIEKLGANYEFAENGLKTLELLKNNHWDLLLLDMQMPIMNGEETIKKIRSNKQTQAVYVIALTANATYGDDEKCIALGCDDYLSKPLNKDLFFKKISHLYQDRNNISKS